MEDDALLSIENLCISHGVEISFVSTLHKSGLLHLTTVDQHAFISVNQLPVFERITRLHHDLEINIEGIETITHLLQRMERMQTEIINLKNRLRLYED